MFIAKQEFEKKDGLPKAVILFLSVSLYFYFLFGVFGAIAGFPVTENFSDQLFQDNSQSSAGWSVTSNQVTLLGSETNDGAGVFGEACKCC